MKKSTIINTLRVYDGDAEATYTLTKIGEKDEATLYLASGTSDDDSYSDCDFSVLVYGEDDDILFCSKDWQGSAIESVEDIVDHQWIAVRIDGVYSDTIMMNGMPRVLPLI